MRLTQSIDYVAIAPLLALAGTALLVLLVDLFAPGRRAVATGLSLLGVLVTLGLVLNLLGDGRSTFCTPATTLPTAAGGIPVPTSCSYVVDGYALLFQVLFCGAAIVVLLLSSAYVEESRIPIGEFHFLLLAAFVGMLTIAASRDLIMLLIALEVVSLPAFVLTGLRRRDPRSTESALKFFLISVLSVAVMLFGMSLIYGMTGSVQLDRIALALARPEARQPVTAAAIVLVIVGFGFKVSAVPFHFWAPDTYQGAPIPIAAFLSVASKAAGFAGLILVLLVGFRPYADVWGPVLAALAVLTMTVGNVVAVTQRHVVRLLAWSSVAQAGYMLVPLGVAASVRGRGSDVLNAAMAATLSYLAIYAVMNIGAFACVVAVARRTPRNLLVDYRGLARTSLPLAVAFAFFLLCLAGLPPGLAGLFAKVVVFRATIDGSVVWLGAIMAVNTVVALYYYIRLAGSLFAGVGERAGEEPLPATRVPRPVTAAIALSAIAALAIGFYPNLVLHLTPLSTLALGRR